MAKPCEQMTIFEEISPIGRKARCAHGRVGIVERVTCDKKGRKLFIGRGLNGRKWQSTQPVWL